MSKLFNDRHRVGTTRMQNWNYAWKGHYFVTVKTVNGVPFFGEIKNAKMWLNDIGIILQREWYASPVLRPDMNIQLGEFVIMPNHFHGIISIGRNPYNGFDVDDDANTVHAVETHCNALQQPSSQNTINRKLQNKFGPQSKNLAAIMRGLKGSVTKQARQINPDFAWQARFYEHVIRDQESHDSISLYIRNNPNEWWNKKGNRFNK